MNDIFPAAPAWFQTILNLSLQAALLTALVWLLCKTLGRWIPPRFRALLWFIVIVRVLFPFAPASPLSLQNLFARRIAPAVPSPARVVKIETNLFAEPIIHFENAPLATAPAQPEPTAFPLAQTLAALWLTGAILAFATLAARCWIIRRRLRSEIQPLPPLRESGSPNLCEIRALLDECRATLGLRYPIRLVLSKAVAAPALTGLYPATLIVPCAFQTGRFTQNQIRQILLHELAHIQQGHLWLHWMTLAARALHWFNPILHLAAARLRHECELAADAAALRNANETERQSYGETILLALTQTTVAPTAIALGMAEQTAGLKQRLRALAEPRRRCFVPLGIALVTLVAITGLTSAETRLDPLSIRARIYGVSGRNYVATFTEAEIARINSRNAEFGTRAREVNTFAAKPVSQISEGTKTHSTNALYTRSFRIDTNSFIAAFQGVGIILTNNTPDSLPSGNLTSQEGLQKLSVAFRSGVLMELDSNRDNFQRAVQQFFKMAGVAFEPIKANQNPGQSQPAVYYHFDAGALFMRATLRDLDIAESAINAINIKSEVVSTTAQIALTDPAKSNDAPSQNGQNQAAQPVVQAAQAPTVIDTDELHPRNFLLDTNVVMNALSRAGITPESSPTPPDWQANWWNLPTSKSLVQYFEREGISFQSPAKSGSKAFFYNNRTGVLFVRANLRDLDRVEKALHKMKAQPLQVAFSVRIIEVPAALAADAVKGFSMRTFGSTNEYIYATKGATNAPAIDASKQIVAKFNNPMASTNIYVPAQEVILPRAAANALVDQLINSKKVDATTLPTLVTLMGRQGRVSIEESLSVVTEESLKTGSSLTFEIGPKMDFLPSSLNEGTLQYSEVLTITEFLGYDDSGDKMPWPRFRVRQNIANIQLPYDSAHLLILSQYDKREFPVVNRIPILSQLLKMDREANWPNRLLVFISPDIVDGAGNRVEMKTAP